MNLPRFSAIVRSRSRSTLWLLCAPWVALAACQAADADLCRVSKTADAAAYTAELEAAREQRDLSFRHDEQSPVPSELRAKWPGLDFYPVDPTLRVEGPLIRRTGGRRFQMATSTGDLRPCQEVGFFVLDLGAGPEQLPVYRFLEEAGSDDSLFLPFTDATTEEGETYPAGRYLEVEALGRDRYRLDFNLAYNPYCAYGGSWDCPVAPPENRLRAAVRAGEKSWHQDDDLDSALD